MGNLKFPTGKDIDRTYKKKRGRGYLDEGEVKILSSVRKTLKRVEERERKKREQPTRLEKSLGFRIFASPKQAKRRTGRQYRKFWRKWII